MTTTWTMNCSMCRDWGASYAKPSDGTYSFDQRRCLRMLDQPYCGLVGVPFVTADSQRAALYTPPSFSCSRFEPKAEP